MEKKYTTNENYGEDVLKAIAKQEALENNFEIQKKYFKKEADEFAIGFAEWFADNTLRVDLDSYKTFGDTDETKPHTMKELLEIYKKEKKL